MSSALNDIKSSMERVAAPDERPGQARAKVPLYVIKIGGNIIDDESKLVSFIKNFAAINARKILVHGGGKMATRLAETLGITQQLVDGRRITDAETLKVVTMVYAGHINKNIVAGLQSAGCNAIGLCGADGNLVRAHKRIHPVTDYGFVGDVDEVNSQLVQQLLDANFSLVCAPITHDNLGGLLNTNADTIAQEIAKGMSSLYDVSLIYCFEKQGVLSDANDDSSVIPMINEASFVSLTQQHVISAGMIPKLHNAFTALQAGVHHISIGHADQLPQLITMQAGTSIVHG